MLFNVFWLQLCPIVSAGKCVQWDLCGASKHKQNPAISCKKAEEVYSSVPVNKENTTSGCYTIQSCKKKKKYSISKWEREGKRSKYLICLTVARGSFSMKQLLVFLPAGKIRKTWLYLLTWAGTPGLTAPKHTACQQTAPRWPALLISQVIGGGKGILRARMGHL